MKLSRNVSCNCADDMVFAQGSRDLFSLGLQLTWRCHEKWLPRHDDAIRSSDDELSADEWKSILTQAKKLGVKEILFTGGEVMIRPDFCDIAECAVDKGFIVNVCTNGLGLTEEIFKRMCALKLKSVSFNLYGGDSKLHDKITGVKGSFAKTLEAMLMFKGAGVNTCIKSVVMRQNFHGLQKLCELGESLKTEVYVADNCADDCLLNDCELNSAYKKNSSREFSEKIFDILSEDTANKNSLTIDPFGLIRPYAGSKKIFGSVRNDTLKTGIFNAK